MVSHRRRITLTAYCLHDRDSLFAATSRTFPQIPPIFHFHISFIYQLPYVTLPKDNAVEYKTRPSISFCNWVQRYRKTPFQFEEWLASKASPWLDSRAVHVGLLVKKKSLESFIFSSSVLNSSITFSNGPYSL
jgi:hypothetical protein